MSIVLDKELYKSIKKKADKKFDSHGIYKSSWIVSQYKKMGGRYGGKKNKDGLTRWYKEKWVDINRPDKSSKYGFADCGRKNTKSIKKYPLCRPLIKVNKNTPRILSDIPKKSILKAQNEKKVIRNTGNVSFAKNLTGGGKTQYYGKKSDIMIKVPKSVKNAALYSLELKKMGFKGGKETGIKRAHQLSTKEYIPIEDVRYIRNWYARHIYTSYPGYKDWINAGKPLDKEWYNKRAILSWYIWGADAGLKWINSLKIIKMLNKEYNKEYTIIS